MHPGACRSTAGRQDHAGATPLLVQRGLTENLAGRFELVPVQILSYQKMLGEPQDGGNTVTLAQYERLCGMLDLREQAELGSSLF